MRCEMLWKLGCLTPVGLGVSPSHLCISAHMSLGLGTSSSAFLSVLLFLVNHLVSVYFSPLFFATFP